MEIGSVSIGMECIALLPFVPSMKLKKTYINRIYIEVIVEVNEIVGSSIITLGNG